MLFVFQEEIIRTLKQASRLFHYCATPLLFSCQWRHNVVEKYRVIRQDSIVSVASGTTTPDSKTVSVSIILNVYRIIFTMIRLFSGFCLTSVVTWPEVIKLFSCSTQFQLLIKTKIPTKEEVYCFKSLKCCIYHANKC